MEVVAADLETKVTEDFEMYIGVTKFVENDETFVEETDVEMLEDVESELAVARMLLTTLSGIRA